MLMPKNCLNAWLQPCSTARYVNRGGEQTFVQPTSSQHSLLYAFFFEGARYSLQALCDRYLNQPAQGRLHYRPASHYVLITFGQNPELRSQDPVQKDIGYVSEQEAIIWVLTMAGHQMGPIFWIDHLAWFTPYVLVSSAYATATGREVYGYPKEMSWLQVPTQPEHLTQLVAATDVFPTFTPNTAATRKPVISISTQSVNDQQPNTQTSKRWRTQRDCFKEISHLLSEAEQVSDSGIVLPGLGLPLQGLEDLLMKAVPFVFLKQFRDIKDGHKPCYQAIVEANTTLKRFRGGGLLHGGWQADIANFASHPIVDDLGFGSTSPSVKLACWLDFDFDIEAGREVLRIV